MPAAFPQREGGGQSGNRAIIFPYRSVWKRILHCVRNDGKYNADSGKRNKARCTSCRRIWKSLLPREKVSRKWRMRGKPSPWGGRCHASDGWGVSLPLSGSLCKACTHYILWLEKYANTIFKKFFKIVCNFLILWYNKTTLKGSVFTLLGKPRNDTLCHPEQLPNVILSETKDLKSQILR